MRKTVLLVTLVLAALLVGSSQARADVSQSEHVRLGFNGTFPFDKSIDCLDDCVEGAFGEDLAGYFFGAKGTASIAVALGGNITLSYDRTALKPGPRSPSTSSTRRRTTRERSWPSVAEPISRRRSTSPPRVTSSCARSSHRRARYSR